uniref:Uncharacterized protein n=1 Tax=Timema genevievae TaxID=629358 RepID=A0A7R9PP23_TIMGE|nr:unnamed protein product [Timema genevievae]
MLKLYGETVLKNILLSLSISHQGEIFLEDKKRGTVSNYPFGLYVYVLITLLVLNTPNCGSNLDFPVIGSLVHCDSSALDHAATEEGLL